MEQSNYTIICINFGYHKLDLVKGESIVVHKNTIKNVFGQPIKIPEEDIFIELYISKISTPKRRYLENIAYFVIDHNRVFPNSYKNAYCVMWADCFLSKIEKEILLDTIQAVSYNLIDDPNLITSIVTNPTKDWFTYYKDNIFKLFETDGNM